jgi:hypothetical protein
VTARSSLHLVLLATALAAAPANADRIENDLALSLFSHNYEGRLEPVIREEHVLEVFKVRGYQIFYIEFEDASVQSESLDRIGIFIESDEYSGKVLAPQRMQELDAEALFDGHDYAVEDVARFYTKAESLAIRLNPSEERLKELLIRLGVMAERDGQYAAAKRAALLAAVAGMDERHGAGTRRWVLDHEFRHGYYFVMLKAGVNRIWREMLSDREREMIAAALVMTARYNPEDSSLMEREFHAMAFEKRFESDLRRLSVPWFTGSAQAAEAEVEALIGKLPEIRRAFLALETQLLPRSS